MTSDAQREPQAAKLREEDPTIAVGRILRQRFELLEEIGRGGLSRVFKARDLVAERAGLAKPVVALKIIEAGADSDPDIVALMYREARRLRDLVHPNIVRVYDMDVEGEIHFMVMEHLE
jgi:serine/threonine protein kinase